MVRMIVTLVESVLFPVLDIDVLDAAHQQFQFVFVEYLDKIQWYQLSKPFQESVHLFLNAIDEAPLYNTPTTEYLNQMLRQWLDYISSLLNVLILVSIVKWNIGTPFNELVDRSVAERFFIHGKC